MAAVNFFLGSIDVNQNVNLFDAEPNFVEAFPNTHYRIDINADMEVLLGIAGNYQQSLSDPNQVNVNLRFVGNEDYLKILLGYPNVYNSTGAVTVNYVPQLNQGPSHLIVGRKGVITGKETTDANMGFRFLEIAAIQIFNHARARAAIRNDTDFVTSMRETVTDIKDKITGYTVINADGSAAVKNDIFNQYVKQNLLVNYPANDVDAVVPFNFQPFNFIGYKTGIQINFNMPFIRDSSQNEIVRSQYNVADDPAVNILLVFHHQDSWGIPA